MNLWNNASPEALQNTYKILHYKNLVCHTVLEIISITSTMESASNGR